MAKFARPKAKPPAPETEDRPVPAGASFANPKEQSAVNVDRAAAGDMKELAMLAGVVKRWNCPDCPGIIREDGLAIHHVTCSYWMTHSTGSDDAADDAADDAEPE